MDYEEKYKKTLEKARKELQACGSVDCDAAKQIFRFFPELKESEDERMVKFIKNQLFNIKKTITENYELDVKLTKAIDWLEKQGNNINCIYDKELSELLHIVICRYINDPDISYPERENVSKKILPYVELLEKQGEQEQLYIRFGEIPTDEKSKIFQGEIEVGTENGVSVYPAFKTSEGDVVLGLSLPITKTTLYTQQHLIEYDDRPCYLVKGDYVGKDTDGQPLINNVSIIEKIDTYRVKEKKQDKESNDRNKPKFKVGDIMRTLEEAKEGITNGLPVVVSIDEEYYHCNNELISIKDKDKYEYPPMNRKQKPAWSEEDENIKESIITGLEMLKDGASNQSLIALYNKKIDWLKSLKDRMQPKPKQEWSEGDETYSDHVITAIKSYYTDDLGEENPWREELLRWLKSLRPQSTWKPSKEQITALEWQKEHLWKSANGDDLPEIDREVVAFQETFPTDVDAPSLFKIVIAHRPNPKGYDGKSVTTGKVEHYTPKTYDKGGWNIPNVVLWLDLNIPNLEED